MDALFVKILEMSLTGSIVIAVVLLARLLLKRAPKIYSYLLWSVVLFRLLCPFSISAGPSVLVPARVNTGSGISSAAYPAVRQAVGIPQESSTGSLSPAPALAKENIRSAPTILDVAAWLWLAGAVGMGAYGLWQLLRLHKRLRRAVPLYRNIYLSGRIPTSFVLGLFRPKIYLSSQVPLQERQYIIAHEQQHIRRNDPFWKLLGYLALCLHWFNPLVWLAFSLAGRDMEMSCDEAVIRRLGPGIRADYAQALLDLSTQKQKYTAMPLSFGVGDIKGRIQNMARWKQPRVWGSVLCILLCAAIALFCGLNPRQQAGQDEASWVVGPPELGDLPEGYSFETDPAGGTVLHGPQGIVGGIDRYLVPDGVYDPNDESYSWLNNVGIPDLEDANLTIDGMFSWSGSNSCSLTVSDGNTPPAVKRAHRFTVAKDALYDLWMDDLLVDTNTQFAIAQAVTFSETAEAPSATEEDLAFARCKAVIDALMNGSEETAWMKDGVLIRTQTEDPADPSQNSTEDYYYDENLGFLQITTYPDGTAQGNLYDGETNAYYTSTGTKDALSWVEATPPDMIQAPWIAGFYLVKQNASYLGTREGTDEFQIDLLFPGMEDTVSSYLADFRFDGDGNFKNVQLTLNPGKSDERILTQSILLPEQTAASRIQEALEKAGKR